MSLVIPTEFFSDSRKCLIGKADRFQIVLRCHGQVQTVQRLQPKCSGKRFPDIAVGDLVVHFRVGFHAVIIVVHQRGLAPVVQFAPEGSGTRGSSNTIHDRQCHKGMIVDQFFSANKEDAVFIEKIEEHCRCDSLIPIGETPHLVLT